MNKKLILLTLTLAAITPATWADGLDLTLTGDIRLGRHPPPPPPPVVVVLPDHEPSGPVPWERGRWYQRSKDYYYYPGGEVYYRPADHVWFYQERGQWRSGRHLPEHVNINFNHSITINMATDRPYRFHQQMVARYPSNYFGLRVRLRDDDRPDRSNNNRDHDDRRPDRDRQDDRHDKAKDGDHQR